MRLFHRTDAADAILAGGFRDGEGSYMLVGLTLRGVFLSNVPVDVNEGAKGDELLEVLLPDGTDLSEYELIEEGKPWREWCVPAALLNRMARAAVVPDDQDAEIGEDFGYRA
jgi:hypothetical protein